MSQKRESKERGIIRIFVASPGDVGELRSRVLWSLEKEFKLMGFSELTGYQLDTIGWEHLPSTTGMPQDVINETLLPKADIVLGFIKHRLGTPVKDLRTNLQRSQSGTVEEILFTLAESSHERKPLLMAYFYDKEPNVNGLFDPDLDRKREEWNDVQGFKNLIKDKAIFNSYSDDIEKEIIKLCTQIKENINLYFEPLKKHIPKEDIDKLYQATEIEDVRKILSQWT